MSPSNRTRVHSAILVAIAVTTLAGSPAVAQRKQARIWGMVTDSNDAPIVGAVVSARMPESGEVVAASETDAEGAYSLLIGDATVQYTYRVEKEGYVPFSGTLEVAIKANAEYNFQLPTADGQSRMGEDGSYSMHPDAVEPFTRGSEAARAGDFDTAFAAFQEVLAVDDQVGPAHEALAAMHLQRGEFALAADNADRARALDPSSDRALALAYTAHKHTGSSIEELTPLLEQMESMMPEKAAAEHSEVGIMHFNAGDMAAAQASFSRAVELAPSLASAHFQLGLCYVNQDDSASARAHFEKVIELAPESEDAVTAQEMLTYIE